MLFSTCKYNHVFNQSWLVKTNQLFLFKISHCDSLRLGIRNLITGAFADVASDVDDEDFVGHVDLAFVHVVEHGFGAFCPDFIVSAVTEQTDGDDDVAFKGESLLYFVTYR